ncbi:MAG: hypothetical protein F6K11_36480 [Leptolyngbya sp. SIO3F4]|nr:hypothetical protein [Leptolyngbya sp. SIO3F4]
MTMRRLALLTSFTSVTLALGSTTAFADTINLGGTVSDYSTISSTATAGASSLNLYGEGSATADVVVKVADVALTSNNTEGVVLQAAADSPLTGGSNGVTLVYNVKLVDDNATAPLAGAFSATSDTVNVDNTDFSSNAAAQDLYIEYDGPEYLDPDNYSSTITMTVQSYL